MTSESPLKAPATGVPLASGASADGTAHKARAPQRADGATLRKLPVAVAGARVMLEQLERIEAHEAGARSGADPEDVHKMRVATRRLRAARRVFRRYLGPSIDLDRANEELRTLAAALGRVRDLDVFAGALRRHAKEAPAADRPAIKRIVAAQERGRSAAQADLRTLLDGGAVDFLRGDFHRALQSVAQRESKAGGPTVRRTAPRLIVRALRRVYAGAESLMAPTSAELHELRITAKRARYTAEFFAPAFDAALDEPIAALTAVQDTLGEVHDADVAVFVLLGTIEGLSGRATSAGADAGPIARLVARYVQERDTHLLAFRERWAALPKPKKLRQALD